MQTQAAMPTTSPQPPVAAASIPELQLPRDNRPNAAQRKDPMVKIRVNSRVDNFVLPGGYLVPRAECVCTVYEPDLPTIQAMVETEPQAIELARGFFEREFEANMQEQLKEFTDDASREQFLAKARSEYPGSIEGKFYNLHRRDIKPLVAVDVVERGIAPPVKQELVEQNTYIAGLVAAEVARAIAQAMPQVLAAMREQADQHPESRGPKRG